MKCDPICRLIDLFRKNNFYRHFILFIYSFFLLELILLNEHVVRY